MDDGSVFKLKNLSDLQPNIYDHFALGDTAIFKVFKGRLGIYFATEVMSERTNFKSDLI